MTLDQELTYEHVKIVGQTYIYDLRDIHAIYYVPSGSTLMHVFIALG